MYLLAKSLSPGLTIHKTQALSIKHLVRGCLEGIFASGQIYVLISRVTDPKNIQLLGVPPIDLLEDVCHAWREAGLDISVCLRKCVTITNEFEYVEGQERIKDRIRPRRIHEKLVPVKNRTLAEILNPQPKCSEVLHKLLDWIDRCDYATQHGDEKPQCKDQNGDDIFPKDPENLWWLTEMSARKPKEAEEEPKQEGDEDGPASEDINDFTDDESSSSEAHKKQKTDSPVLPVH